MIFSFLIIPLFITFFYLSLKGLGYFFSQYLFKNNSTSLSLYPLISFPIIFFLLTVVHFFTKIYPFANLLLLLIGLILYFVKVKKNENLLLYLIILLVLSIQFYGHDVNEDYGYYHLPYIINFVSDKLILGLSHLSMVQGYNSAWLNVSSFFYLPFFSEKSVHFANSVLFFSVLVFYLNFLFKKENLINFPISSIYAIFAITFFIIKNSRLNSFGIDVPGHIYASIVFFLFIYFFEKKDFSSRKFIFYLISIFSVFGILIKLSYISLILFPILCLFYERKILDKKIFFVTLIFGLSWIIQQINYTSCIIFPIDFTCIKSLPWYSKNFINDAAFGLEYINKSYWNYEGSLAEYEYIKNFNWLNTWFKRNLVELTENIFTFIAPIILLIFYGFIKTEKNKFFEVKKFLLVLSIPIISGFLIWFLKAPVVRYGIFYLNTVLFLIFLLTFKHILINKLNRNFIFFILIAATSFNLIKNSIRILNIEIYKDLPFPMMVKIIYETEKKNNLDLNTPISQGDIQSGVCWNTPVYCRAGKFDNLNISKNNGYLIITPK